MSAGRPTIYTEELALEICTRLASGRSLRSISNDEDMPDARTVHYWRLSNPSFFQQYEAARQIQAETLVDELLDIADDGTNDWMERTGKDGENLGWVVNGEAVQRSRLRLDTRKWYASKIIPKIYGEKQTVDLNAQVHSTVVIDASTLPTEQLDAILASE